MDDSRPTARALVALEVLQDSPGVSAQRLAERLGVTERAVRRYVALLRDIGIPIESSTGRYGGYRLGRGTRPPPLMLSAAEALGLAVAATTGRAAGGAEPVDSAIAKIVRVLPSALADTVDAMRHVSTDRLPPLDPPDPKTVAALVRAAESGRRVRLTYRMSRVREMDVDPWAVSIWRGRWYLLGWSHTGGGRRVLRVDRVVEVVLLDDTFTRPVDLDPIAMVEEHLSGAWEHPVEVVVDAPVEAVASWVPANLGRLEALEPGRTRIIATTGDMLWYARRLTAIEAPFRIVSPPELQEAARFLGGYLTRAGTVEDAPAPGQSSTK